MLAVPALLFGLNAALAACFNEADDDDDNDDNNDTDDDNNDDDSGGDDDNDADDDDNDNDDDDLVWEDPPQSSTMTWSDAINHCSSLGGDWRLPTINELRSFVVGCDATSTGGDCQVGDDCLEMSCQGTPCQGCTSGAGPDGGCYWDPQYSGTCSTSNGYWSSSVVADNNTSVWLIGFDSGFLGYTDKENLSYVRCVR
jgi:hypothetical protein